MPAFDPDRPDFAPYGFSCVRWRPSPMDRPDHHHEIEINYLYQGWITYLFGGRKVKVAGGRLIAFWAAIPHQILEYENTPDYFVATIPLAWFLQCKLPGWMLHRLLNGEVLAEPGEDSSDFDSQTFARWVEDLKDPSEGMEPVVMLEMQARLLRMALALQKKPEACLHIQPLRLGEGGLSLVEQMACFVAQHYQEKLKVEDIATCVGLHPNYAMTLFQKTFGTTLIDCLTQHRISHAQRLLATTDDKIVSVALESGFASLSRFNEVFQQRCGCTPREFRNLNRTLR